MSRNRFVVALGLVAAVVIMQTKSAAAQPFPRLPPDSARIARMVDQLAKEVSLTSAQKDSITHIYRDSFAALQAEMQKHRGDFRAMRDIRRKNTEARNAKITALLTDEQKKKFDRYVKKQRAMMRSRRRTFR